MTTARRPIAQAASANQWLRTETERLLTNHAHTLEEIESEYQVRRTLEATEQAFNILIVVLIYTGSVASLGVLLAGMVSALLIGAGIDIVTVAVIIWVVLSPGIRPSQARADADLWRQRAIRLEADRFRAQVKDCATRFRELQEAQSRIAKISP